ncbi:MAG: hypothetical protein IPM69_10740 [Ignavibacteria bacterium]|nr:hypothetical protein [Ignavibacteria bacterium]
MIKFSRLLFLSVITLSACSTDPAVSTVNDSFTPPTTYFYKIDGISNSISADAPKASLFTGDFRLSKNFPFGGQSETHVSLHLVALSSSTVANTLSEGSYTSIYLTKQNSNSPDSAMLTLQILGNNANPNAVYELIAQGGRVYLSKKNGILRFTTDGKLTASGLNSQPPGDAQTRTVEFSVENGVSF